MSPRRTEPRPDPASASSPGLDRLIAALRLLPDAVVVVDDAGSEVLRSATADRFVGARHADAIAEAAIAEMLADACRGESSARELQLYGPPREVLSLTAQPLVEAGQLLGAMVVIRDMTEARRTDEVRRDFVANVSHELKTPVGALGLLADTIAAGGDEAVTRQLAERIGREADRLAQIIDDLLDLSIIEVEEAPERETLAVAMLVDQAVERARAGADALGVPVVVVPVARDLAAVCDRRQVVSALTNLIDNAVKYSEPGARVSVETSVLADDLVEIAVADRGIGIPSRDLERIFERFYRVDRARSRATGGTGLGLSIVRHVAQAHGGEVAVESTEGVGSTFRFRIPMHSTGSVAVFDETTTSGGTQRG